MTEPERDRKAYALAKEYLLGLAIPGVTPALVEKYLRFSQTRPRPDTVAGIYQALLVSAQNANMKAGVIGGSIDGVEKLGVVLSDFEPAGILGKFSSGPKAVLDEIEARLKPRGKIRRTPRSIWPHYCLTILSAARFMAQFPSATEFYKWADFFDQDDRARPALPMLLAREIEGLGFALSCDFLKELGYASYAKPDVHVSEIFGALQLCPPGSDDYDVFKAIVRVAKHADVTPYNVDKLFWLIGSGRFYDDPQLGNDGKVGSNKKGFIKQAKAKLAG
jgi:hypothetical protein